MEKSEKNKHLELIKKKFKIKCSKEIFSHKEIENLENYGVWLESLCHGKINPVSKEQAEFIEKVKKGIEPKNEIAKVWFKYINRLRIERELGNRLYACYTIGDQDFYSREDYYKLHKGKKP